MNLTAVVTMRIYSERDKMRLLVMVRNLQFISTHPISI